MKSRIKLFITDVDGTLTDENQKIVLEAIERLWELKRRGVKVGLASALPYCSLKYLAMYFGLDKIIIAEGGGVVEVEGKIETLASKDVAVKALNLLKELFRDRIVEKWSNNCRLADVSIERTLRLEEVLEAVKGLRVKVVDTKYAYHILEEDVDKGYALKKIIEYLGISKSEVVVAGDSIGDYELFLEAGVKIAPSNASRELKMIADYVSPYFGGYGLADGIKWLLERFF